jgi:hypothetical protein
MPQTEQQPLATLRLTGGGPRREPAGKSRPWRSGPPDMCAYKPCMALKTAAAASPAPRAPLGRSRLGNGLPAPSLKRRETTMTTSATRVRALREGERRGSRSFTIGVSEHLRVIAKHDYKAF